MPQFERNDKSFIENIVERETNDAQLGKVTRTFEHANATDDSNFEVDVQIVGQNRGITRCSCHTPGSDIISPPKVGDTVLVLHTDGEATNPIAIGTNWTNKDRAPVGRAGMYRNRFESADSPAGAGDLHITGYTSYNPTVADNNKNEVEPQTSVIQLSKHVSGSMTEPHKDRFFNMLFEMYDSPQNDQAWVKMEFRKVNGSPPDKNWGMEFNLKTGQWKIVGPKGFGITSDGEGNFTWEHKSINFKEVNGSVGSLEI